MDSAQVGTHEIELGTAVPSRERKLNKREVAWRFLVGTIRRAGDAYGGLKKLAAACGRTDRAARYWARGDKEPGAVDLLLAARSDKGIRARIVAFLHIPESRLHRAEAEIAAIEAQADELAADALATLAYQAREVGGWRRARLSTLAQAAGRLTRLRFRRRPKAEVL